MEVPPLQGVVVFTMGTQGGDRSGAVLPWAGLCRAFGPEFAGAEGGGGRRN